MALILLGGTGLLLAALLPASRITLVVPSLFPPLAAAAFLAGFGHYFRTGTRDPRLSDGIDALAQLLAFMVVIGIASYLAATRNAPLWDEAFLMADRALGFEWRAYLQFVNERSWLGTTLSLAYQSFLPQVALLAFVLSFAGQGAAARRLIIGLIMAGLVTVAISTFTPALGLFEYLRPDPADYATLSPSASFIHARELQAVRASSVFELHIAKFEGIVAFPSYHTAAAVLLLLAGYAHRWLRWPFVVLNVVMIAATPIDGGHYLVDVLAGVAVALGCHWGAGHLLETSAARTVDSPVMMQGRGETATLPV